jgi:hypothetical protein
MSVRLIGDEIRQFMETSGFAGPDVGRIGAMSSPNAPTP